MRENLLIYEKPKRYSEVDCHISSRPQYPLNDKSQNPWIAPSSWDSTDLTNKEVTCFGDF